jgi:pre-mRNA-splicing factor ISY1
MKEKTRAELYRHIDADYYGYRDEEDGTLLEFEDEQESVGMGSFLTLAHPDDPHEMYNNWIC